MTDNDILRILAEEPWQIERSRAFIQSQFAGRVSSITVDRYLQRLLASGQIVRIRFGEYRLAMAPPRQLTEQELWDYWEEGGKLIGEPAKNSTH